MKPEDVPQKYFEVTKIIYNNGEFAVAFGYYDGDTAVPRLAMRWNHYPDDRGFPLLKNQEPAWFQLPNSSVWFSKMLQAVNEVQAFEVQMKDEFKHEGRLQLREY